MGLQSNIPASRPRASFEIFLEELGAQKLALFQKMHDFWAPNDSRKKFSNESGALMWIY